MYKPGFENTIPRKPDCFVVGAPKCGTTSLYYYFSQHSEIFLLPKELHFFCNDLHFSNPQCSEERYKLELQKATNQSLIADVETYNLCSKNAAQNIYQMNPDAKIIIMLRNPVRFLQSLHAQHRVNGSQPIVELAQAYDQGGINSLAHHHTSALELYNYQEMANFLPQVKRYYDHFPKRNIKVLLLENIQADTRSELNEVWRFLKLEAPQSLDLATQNKRKTISNYKLYSWIKSGKGLGKKIGKAVFRNSSKRKAFKEKLLSRFLQETNRKEAIEPQLYSRIFDEYEQDFDTLAKITGVDFSPWYSN